MELNFVFCRPVLFTMIALEDYLPILVKLGSPAFRRFIVDHLPYKNASRLRDILDIMFQTSVGILKAKERALQEGDEAVKQQIGRGQDIISILSMPVCNPNTLLFITHFFVFLHQWRQTWKHQMKISYLSQKSLDKWSPVSRKLQCIANDTRLAWQMTYVLIHLLSHFFQSSYLSLSGLSYLRQWIQHRMRSPEFFISWRPTQKFRPNSVKR